VQRWSGNAFIHCWSPDDEKGDEFGQIVAASIVE